MPRVLILSAGSDIGRAIAHCYAKAGYDLILTARNPEDIGSDKSDIEIRYGSHVEIRPFDACAYASHADFLQGLGAIPDGVIYVAGYLGNNEYAKTDFDEVRNIIDVNYTGAVSILNLVANAMEQRGKGFIVGISSVAGDRGRQSNTYYGSAKAGLNAYLSGLRNRLAARNIQVLTVKPGYVRTKMTEGFDMPPVVTANPDQVARDIFAAQQKGRNEIYTLWMWRYIMLIIKLLPESIFKALKI